MAVNYTSDGPIGTVAGFSHYNANIDYNVSGGANVHTLVFDTEIFDTGGVMDGTTFTAPLTGKYLMFASWSLDDLDGGSHTYIDAGIYTSNRQYTKYDFYMSVTGGLQEERVACIADMDINDTAVCKTNVQAGSVDVDFIGGSTSHFSVMLIS